MIDPKLLGWVESPSGGARLQLRDGFLRNGKWQDGTVLLIPPGSRELEVSEFKRPNDAVINDAGFAVIADSLSLDKPLQQGELCFLAPDGTVYRRCRLDQNLGCLAMDPEGRLVFVTTAASENHKSKLMCFSVSTGELVWGMAVPKPAAEITVVGDDKCIHIGRPYQVPDFDFLLKVTYEGRVIEKRPASPYEALTWAEAERQAGRFSIAERWFRVAAEAEIAASYRAKAYRGLGELAENDARPKDALDLYQRALTLDANVGVARRIRLLRRLHGNEL